ncbi:MAG: hypothetical protein L0G36_06985, partial [Brevibacterium sp.]|nr:hypothetical protein [Brevibacterium sp.]
RDRDGSTTFDDLGGFAGANSGDDDADHGGQVVEGQVSEGRGSKGHGSIGNFDPKDYLDENGELDLSHIGDDVKKATGIDVQSYIAEALRRRDGRDGDSGGSGSNGSGSNGPKGDGPTGGSGSNGPKDDGPTGGSGGPEKK